MKLFESLSEQELIALTQDEVARYIDYQCAEDGVPLIPSVLPEPSGDFPEPDTTVYEIKVGYSGTSIMARSAVDAAKILDTLRDIELVQTTYIATPSSRSSVALTSLRSEFTVCAEEVYSEALAAHAKDLMSGAKQQREMYAKSKKAYDAAVKERAYIVDAIHEKIDNARAAIYERQTCAEKFARYVELAEGNQRIAWLFLLKAMPNAAELLPVLAQKFSGVPAPEPRSTKADESADTDIPF